MTDEDFVREIHTQPSDDFLRSVYADWLEEQGDPRSDFLRVEIALASLEPNDAERGVLEARLEELSQGVEWEWLRSVSRPVIDIGTRVDVNNVTSIAFIFLEKLYDQCQEQKGWGSVQTIGRELGLSENEIKDVVQHLTPLRMIECRGGSRQNKAAATLTNSVAISAKGRAHVKTMLGLPLDRKTIRHRTSRKGEG